MIHNIHECLPKFCVLSKSFRIIISVSLFHQSYFSLGHIVLNLFCYIFIESCYNYNKILFDNLCSFCNGYANNEKKEIFLFFPLPSLCFSFLIFPVWIFHFYYQINLLKNCDVFKIFVVQLFYTYDSKIMFVILIKNFTFMIR